MTGNNLRDTEKKSDEDINAMNKEAGLKEDKGDLNIFLGIEGLVSADLRLWPGSVRPGPNIRDWEELKKIEIDRA